MKKRVLAFDFGASGGRAMLGEFDGNAIALTEVHRFDNNPVMLHGTFYWDVLGLFHEIKQGIVKAKRYGEFDTIGIDTWGVDFGLLDADGRLLENPVHYRDARTDGTVEEIYGIIGREELYNRTGIQIMAINTLFQMYSLAKNRPELLKRASCALFMPDLFGYFLTGQKTSEYSIASTSQMMNPHAHDWDSELLTKLGIPADLFPGIVKPGTPLGTLTPELQEELGVGPVEVVSIAGHDTACAVAAVPADEKDFIYISCGTWSLFGTETEAPVINADTMRRNVTNEGGYDYTIRLLKNIIGLWMIQETRRQYRRDGKDYSYADMERLALESRPFGYFVDPDAPEFGVPGNIPKKIREYCERTGQGSPSTDGEVIRCIYESLAMKYRYTFAQMRVCTNRDYATIHMVGGGTKDSLLCRMTADATNRKIIAGPIEATALGNVAVQLLAKGTVKDLNAARGIIKNSFSPAAYSPEDTASWDSRYQSFLNICGLN